MEEKYIIYHSEEDDCWIGKIEGQEFLGAHGDTPQDALKEIMEVFKFVQEDLAAEAQS